MEDYRVTSGEVLEGKENQEKSERNLKKIQ